MKHVTDGITMLNRYGSFKNACWILHNNGEAAVVEMPPYTKNRNRAPYEDTRRFLKSNRLFLKYAFLTHAHWDHSCTLPHFRYKFPQAHFVTHRSFLHDNYFRFGLSNVYIKNRKSMARGQQYFDSIFEGYLWQGDIGGEPVYIIYAPKHSYADQLIIFKGAMITGDWYLGDLNDCNDLVSTSDKIDTINRVEDIVRHLGYQIHMLFSGHGDHLFYKADFFSIMEECKINHKGKHPKLKAELAI